MDTGERTPRPVLLTGCKEVPHGMPDKLLKLHKLPVIIIIIIIVSCTTSLVSSKSIQKRISVTHEDFSTPITT